MFLVSSSYCVEKPLLRWHSPPPSVCAALFLTLLFLFSWLFPSPPSSVRFRLLKSPLTSALPFLHPGALQQPRAATKNMGHKKAAEYFPRRSYPHEGVGDFCLEIELVPDYFLDHLRASNLLL